MPVLLLDASVAHQAIVMERSFAACLNLIVAEEISELIHLPGVPEDVLAGFPLHRAHWSWQGRE